MKSNYIATILALIAGLAGSARAAQEFASFGLAGVSTSEGWYNLNNSNYAGYGGFATSTAAWPSAIASNFGSGDAGLNKLAGTSGYLASAATNGIYTPATPLGSFTVSDATPLAGLGTVVFQLDIEIASGTFAAPVLSYNGGSQNLAADFSSTVFSEVKSGGMGASVRYVYAYQWDLVSAGTITDFSIAWTVPAAHTITYGAQLQQSDAFAGSAIPEPSSFTALAGLGVLGLAASRRRRA